MQGTSVDAPDTFGGCGRTGDRMFFMVLKPKQSLNVGMKKNDFSSRHAVMWSQACPLKYLAGLSALKFLAGLSGFFVLCRLDPRRLTRGRCRAL